jgi:hypothetical protein
MLNTRATVELLIMPGLFIMVESLIMLEYLMVTEDFIAYHLLSVLDLLSVPNLLSVPDLLCVLDLLLAPTLNFILQPLFPLKPAVVIEPLFKAHSIKMGEPTIRIHNVADETTGHLLDRSHTANYGIQAEDARVCIAMVGLPARGKSYTAQKLTRWLHWLSIPAQTFNVGMYRRKESPKPSAEFFDTSNPEGERLRRAAAENAVNDMINWFRTSSGVVAILDATNSTKSRRKWIRERCSQENIATMFVESICNDQGLIMSNIRDVKTTSPDYAGMNPEKAATDFLRRIEKYQNQYETIDDDEDDLTYVKMIDVGAQIIVQGIQDMLQTRVVYFLMNLHIRPRTIWLSRVSRRTDMADVG